MKKQNKHKHQMKMAKLRRKMLAALVKRKNKKAARIRLEIIQRSANNQ